MTKKEPISDPVWKNEHLPLKNQIPEKASQDPSPKSKTTCGAGVSPAQAAGTAAPQKQGLVLRQSPSQAQLCKTADLLTKKEPADSHPADPVCKTEDLPTKNEPEEFEDLEGQQMYANYLARFPEARNAPIIPNPRKKAPVPTPKT